MIQMPSRNLIHHSLAAIIYFISCIPASAEKTDLDRVAYAVEGVESSHGKNLAMWRTDAAGPQGPMQVSEKAALDIGGGNRFDVEENRSIGRAYLGLLHKRYGNWADAISAYNWGMGRVDGWIRQGRPSMNLLPGVSTYLRRVLHDSGLPAANRGKYGARLVSTAARNDDILLPALQQSGLPLGSLANSGTPLPALEQSGRPLLLLTRSGRSLAARRYR